MAILLPPVVTASWRSHRAFYRAGLAILVIFLFFQLFSASSHSGPRSYTQLTSKFQSYANISHPQPLSSKAEEFWRKFSDQLEKGRPSFAEVKRKDKTSPWITYQKFHQESQRPDLLELKQKRSRRIEELETRRNRQFQQARESGSTLPVEVWFETYESYEKVPCDEIFPQLGAKCMFMVDYLPKDLAHPPQLSRFIYKTITLMMSTFEQIMWMDGDAFPVNNPDSIFETDPFASHGFVIWPDYWASTTSKYMYEINDRPIPDIQDMASSETGIVLIDKATHASVLLLINFYNMYGETHWYRLLSQAAPGEGDKDTFLTAVKDLDLPWYQVNEPPTRVGYRCDGHKHSVGTAFSHPLDDYRFTVNNVTRHDEGMDFGAAIHPRILFIHGNLPKYDPYSLLDWDMPNLEWRDLLRCNDGKGEAHRMWGPKEMHVIKYGWDVERSMWNALRWEACVHETDYMIWITGSIFRPTEKLRHDLCSGMTKMWEELFPGEQWTPELPAFGKRKELPWGAART